MTPPSDIPLFVYSTPLAVSPEVAFAFHENPENMRLIAPASLRVVSIDCEPHARVGAEFRIRARQFGLPIAWTGYWAEVDRPHSLSDGAHRSPFRYWMHTHAFAPDPEGCTMTDSIACLLPLGPLSRIATRLVMPFVFGPMFSARHRATRDWAQRVRDGKL